MAYIISMPPPEEGGPVMLGVQTRAESVVPTREHKDYPPETTEEIFPSLMNDGRCFAVERGKGYLCELLAFFDNPENRRLCDLTVPPPFPTGV